MEYTKQILLIEKLINDVLISLNQDLLFQNKVFSIDSILHNEHYVKVILKKTNAVSLLMEICDSGLRIDIDRAEEIIDLDYEYIYKNMEEVSRLLKMIFTSTIMVQYCGKYITNLYFIKNESVETYRYTSTLIPIKFSRYCEEKVYVPIF